MSRRAAIAQMSSAAAAFLAAHDALASPPAAVGKPASAIALAKGYEPRIREVRLLTAVPLKTMREFYRDTLGFALNAESETQITFNAGGSRLTFVAAKPEQFNGDGGRVGGDGKPMYHFAFNIPQNAILAACDWQRQRTELVPTPENLRDPAYPDDVRHFANWNAHSVFYFDPAFNIVEYIARHDLANDADDPKAFSAKSIECISEIGFVTDPAPASRDAAVKMLRDNLGLHEYPRGSTPWAMGDQTGLLLILANKGNLWGENTATPVRWDVFETHAIVRGEKDAVHAFEGLPYRVQVRS